MDQLSQLQSPLTNEQLTICMDVLLDNYTTLPENVLPFNNINNEDRTKLKNMLNNESNTGEGHSRRNRLRLRDISLRIRNISGGRKSRRTKRKRNRRTRK
jgi:hypothetical protein